MEKARDRAGLRFNNDSTHDIKKIAPVAAIFAAVLLWGGSFSGMRVAIGVLNPMSVMWLRMMIALVIIAPFIGRLIPKNYEKGDWKPLLLMAFFQPCLYFLLESYALKYTTSSQAGVISASVPLLVAIAAWLTLAEPLNRNTIAGLFVSIAGVTCLTLINNPLGTAENPLLGNSLEFLAMVSAAANLIMVKKLGNRYSPWTITAIQIVIGSFFFMPGLAFLIEAGSSIWNLKLIAIFAFLGGFVTLGAFGLYYWGMAGMPASRASVFINLVPVNAVLFGWLFLDESLTFVQCLAASAVVFGVWFSQRSRY